MALSLIGTLALGLTLVPSNLFVLAQVAQAGTVVRRYNVPRNAPASDYHRHKRFSGVKRTLVDTVAEELKKRDMDYYVGPIDVADEDFSVPTRTVVRRQGASALPSPFVNGASFGLSVVTAGGVVTPVWDEPQVYTVVGGLDTIPNPQLLRVQVVTTGGQTVPTSPFSLLSVTVGTACTKATCYVTFTGTPSDFYGALDPNPPVWTIDQSTGLLSATTLGVPVIVVQEDVTGDLRGYAAGSVGPGTVVTFKLT